jgi:HD-GYP domain-containing protein (c-di-GMP phosphodiesterase class II)
VRLAELMAALSVAVDLAMGDEVEHAQRSAVLAAVLGEAAGLTEAQAQDAYYLALLRTVGCTGDHDFAFRLYGEDISEWMGLAAMGAPSEMLASIVRNVGKSERGLRRVARVARALGGVPQVVRNSQIHCELGAMLSRRLGLGPGVVAGLDQVFERWDGSGFRKLRGEAIALPVRVALLASDIELATRKLGPAGAIELLRRRGGKGHDPRLVELLCQRGPTLIAALDRPSIWQAVLDAEPGPRAVLEGDRLDLALRSAGEFADMKSVFTRGHSAGVAELAGAACVRLGLPATEIRAAVHAGHLHDLGRVGVRAYLWDKPGPLGDSEWERVRLHSYYTERALSRLQSLGPAAALACQAHERRDGSGYHRRPPTLPGAARALAAADVYQALTSPRPHRPAFAAAAAATELRRSASDGHLDAEAVEAVLASAGHSPRRARELPAGLSARELEVLRLLARGLTNKEIASALDISTRTAGHHVEHIFSKAGVTTRAAAALFAMQNDLLAQ